MPERSVVVRHQPHENRESHDEIDDWHQGGSRRQQHAREVHPGHERNVRDDAPARRRQRGREVRPEQESGIDEDRVLLALGGEVRELPEDEREHDHRQERLQDRPRDADERLLVANLYVAPHEAAEQLAVVPQLAQVEARPARGRPDDGHSVGPGRERVSDAIDCPATDRTRWFRLRDRTVGRAAHGPDATGPVPPLPREPKRPAVVSSTNAGTSGTTYSPTVSPTPVAIASRVTNAAAARVSKKPLLRGRRIPTAARPARSHTMAGGNARAAWSKRWISDARPV